MLSAQNRDVPNSEAGIQMILRARAGALTVALSGYQQSLRRFTQQSIVAARHLRYVPSPVLGRNSLWRQKHLRSIHAASSKTTSQTEESPPPQAITLTFVLPDNTEKSVQAKIGDTILEVAHANHIELEGACEGSCSCSTCHVILEQKVYDELPEPSEQEEDMLDLAMCLTPTSRLGCQVRITPDLNNAKIKLPQMTRNFYVDGHVPTPH